MPEKSLSQGWQSLRQSVTTDPLSFDPDFDSQKTHQEMSAGAARDIIAAIEQEIPQIAQHFDGSSLTEPPSGEDAKELLAYLVATQNALREFLDSSLQTFVRERIKTVSNDLRAQIQQIGVWLGKHEHPDEYKDPRKGVDTARLGRKALEALEQRVREAQQEYHQRVIKHEAKREGKVETRTNLEQSLLELDDISIAEYLRRMTPEEARAAANILESMIEKNRKKNAASIRAESPTVVVQGKMDTGQMSPKKLAKNRRRLKEQQARDRQQIRKPQSLKSFIRLQNRLNKTAPGFDSKNSIIPDGPRCMPVTVTPEPLHINPYLTNTVIVSATAEEKKPIQTSSDPHHMLIAIPDAMTMDEINALPAKIAQISADAKAALGAFDQRWSIASTSAMKDFEKNARKTSQYLLSAGTTHVNPLVRAGIMTRTAEHTLAKMSTFRPHDDYTGQLGYATIEMCKYIQSYLGDAVRHRKKVKEFSQEDHLASFNEASEQYFRDTGLKSEINQMRYNLYSADYAAMIGYHWAESFPNGDSQSSVNLHTAMHSATKGIMALENDHNVVKRCVEIAQDNLSRCSIAHGEKVQRVMQILKDIERIASMKK